MGQRKTSRRTTRSKRSRRPRRASMRRHTGGKAPYGFPYHIGTTEVDGSFISLYGGVIVARGRMTWVPRGEGLYDIYSNTEPEK